MALVLHRGDARTGACRFRKGGQGRVVGCREGCYVGWWDGQVVVGTESDGLDWETGSSKLSRQDRHDWYFWLGANFLRSCGHNGVTMLQNSVVPSVSILQRTTSFGKCRIYRSAFVGGAYSPCPQFRALIMRWWHSCSRCTFSISPISLTLREDGTNIELSRSQSIYLRSPPLTWNWGARRRVRQDTDKDSRATVSTVRWGRRPQLLTIYQWCTMYNLSIYALHDVGLAVHWLLNLL